MGSREKSAPGKGNIRSTDTAKRTQGEERSGGQWKKEKTRNPGIRTDLGRFRKPLEKEKFDAHQASSSEKGGMRMSCEGEGNAA